MKLVVDVQDRALLDSESEPVQPASDRDAKAGSEPRFADLRRGDNIHRLALSQETADDRPIEAGELIESLTQGFWAQNAPVPSWAGVA